MNIGIVTAWFDRGAGYVARAYAEALRQGHNISIYARGKLQADPEDAYWNWQDVFRASPHPSDKGVYKGEFVRWLEDRRLDAVIFNEQRRWDAVVWARECGVRVGAYVDYYTQETVPLFDLYDFLMCNTRRHHGVFLQHPQAHYWPWGTDTAVFAPGSDFLSEKRPLTFFANAGLEGSFDAWGMAHNRRGTSFALKAFAFVKEDVRLVVHSQLPLSECSTEWQELVQGDPRISFREGTVRPPGLYHLGDVYVYPSKLDGLGLTLPEAMACGLAPITTDTPPMNEFVSDHETGRLVRVREYRGRADGYYWPESYCDIEHLAQVISDYARNPADVRKHRQAARRYAEERLSWKKNAAELPAWIERQRRLDITPARLQLLKAEAARHDRSRYPTPAELLGRGAVNLLRRVGFR